MKLTTTAGMDLEAAVAPRSNEPSTVLPEDNITTLG